MPFTFNGTKVRVVLIDQVPWWVVVDVCAVLGIANSRNAADRLDPDDVCLADTIDSMGRTQRVQVVNEAGLYELIIRSDKPDARAFRKWVTHDVIPTIRKTGSYSALPKLPASFSEALRELADTVEQRDQLQTQVAELEPSAHAWDVLGSAQGDYPVREAAYILSRDPNIKTGQKRLFGTMRKLRMIGPDNIPYSEHSAHLVLRPQWSEDPETGERTKRQPQTRITIEGLLYLHKKLGGVARLQLGQLPLGFDGDR